MRDYQIGVLLVGKTIKQVAADLNVSKPTVTKAIEICGLSNSLIRVGNRFELTDAQAELVKSQISQSNDSPKTKNKLEIMPNKTLRETQKIEKTQIETSKIKSESEIMRSLQNPDYLETPKTEHELKKTQTESPNSVIALLQEQIKLLQQQLAKKDEQLYVKDEQLAVKDKQLGDLTSALVSAQEQHKALTDALTAAQALHAGTIQERLTVAEHPNAEESNASVEETNFENSSKKSGFFSKLFRKADR